MVGRRYDKLGQSLARVTRERRPYCNGRILCECYVYIRERIEDIATGFREPEPHGLFTYSLDHSL